MNKTLVASMEAIDFQRNSTLIKELAMQFDTAFKTPTAEVIKSIVGPLEKIAFKHTGMKFRFNFIRGQGVTAFVIPPQADSANPMRADEVVQRVRKLGRPASEQEIFKGVVDVKNGKVSGIYSEIPVDVFLATEFFDGSMGSGFTGAHLAAITVHEIGHGFGYLRYLGKLTISNIVVSEITRRQHEGADDKVVQEVIKVAEQKTGYRLRDLGTINRDTDPLVIQQIVMTGMVDSIRSELGTKFYDRRAFEFVADQFVARHGGAHLIVEGLDYLYRAHPEYTREYRGRVGNIMASLTGYGILLCSALALAGGVVVMAVGAPVGAIMALWGIFGTVLTMFGEVDHGVYDPIIHRYAAMRRELISSSKDQFLSVNQRKEIINQIESIDVIISSISDKGFFGPQLIGEFLVGIFTGRPAEQKFQRMLEELVNNRLYEMSNKLQAKTV
ncbi:hypothetical protein D3C85_14830 [compost metagenome]